MDPFRPIDHHFSSSLISAPVISAEELNSELISAVKEGNLDKVDALLAAGADIDTSLGHFTPLHLASDLGNSAIVAKLLQAGANINAVTVRGFTPLHVACSKGYVAIVAQLLEGGANINAPVLDPSSSFVNGASPLHVACQCGKEATVAQLLEAGANKEARTSRDLTPLHVASRFGYSAIVEQLLSAGVDKNAVGFGGLTPLHAASEYGYVVVVAQLLEAGADKEVVNLRGFTPLYVASRNGQEAVVVRLLKAGANPSASDFGGLTPIHVASMHGHPEVVKQLLDAGANKDAVNIRGFSPLHVASAQGHSVVVGILLASGANVNLVAHAGDSPLHIASRIGHFNVIKKLVQAGARLNICNDENHTAAQDAAIAGHHSIVRLLLIAQLVSYEILKKAPICLELFSNETTMAWNAFIEQSMDTNEARFVCSVNTWINKLQQSVDYQKKYVRSIMVARIDAVLAFAHENLSYKAVTKDIVNDAIGTCTDRAQEALNQLELQRKLLQCSTQSDKEVLRLFKGAYKMQLLTAIGCQMLPEMAGADQVEVILGLQVRLKELLDLPIECEGLNFYQCSELTYDRVLVAYSKVEEEFDRSTDAFIEFLVGHETWTERLAKMHPQEYEALQVPFYDQLNALPKEMDTAEYAAITLKIMQGRSRALKEWHKTITEELLGKEMSMEQPAPQEASSSSGLFGL